MKYVLEANSEREGLNIPEYGRNMQKMVNHCRELPTKEERNIMANAIIEVMGNFQPHLRDVPDFKHKLWDQLFIIAGFDLDVDAPYEVVKQEEILTKPSKLPYPKTASKYKFYGNNIQIMIDEAITWEKNDLRDKLEFAIANHMKKCFLNWNKDTVDDDVIFKHLKQLSNDDIDLTEKEIKLSPISALLRKKTATNNSSNKSKNKKRNYRKK